MHIKLIEEDDIFEAHEDIIALIAECSGHYDTGFAKRIKYGFPDTYYKHHEFCERHFNIEIILGQMFVSECSSGHMLASLYARIEKSAIEIEYEAFRKSISILRDYAKQHEKRIAIPYHFDTDESEWNNLIPIIEEIMPEGILTEYIKYERSEVPHGWYIWSDSPRDRLRGI